MFRSPISLLIICTLALSSSRRATSAGESAAALVTFWPGILSKNHHEMMPITMRETKSINTRRHEPINFTSRERGIVFACYPIFLRKNSAQRAKSTTDMMIRISKCGQYSKKLAPRRMIARIKEMKYVVGRIAPSA